MYSVQWAQVGVRMSREVAEACERINWAGVAEVGEALAIANISSCLN